MNVTPPVSEFIEDIHACYFEFGIDAAWDALESLARDLDRDLSKTDIAKIYGETSKLLRATEPSSAIQMARTALKLDPVYSRMKWLAKLLWRHHYIREPGMLAGQMLKHSTITQQDKNWIDQAIWLSEALKTGNLSLPTRHKALENNRQHPHLAYITHMSAPYHHSGYVARSEAILNAFGTDVPDLKVSHLTRPGYPLDMRMDIQTTSAVTVHLPASPLNGSAIYKYINDAADTLEQHFKKIRPTAVQAASNAFTGLPALIAARRLGIPFIYEMRGLWDVTRASRDPVFANSERYEINVLLEIMTAKAADKTYAISEGLAEFLIQTGVPENRISLWPNCAGSKPLKSPALKQRLRHKLGLGKAPVFGYIGSMVDYEGLMLAVKAAHLLWKNGHQFQLLLVGDGPVRVDILGYIARHNLAEKIIAPGRLPEDLAPKCYSVMTASLLPRLSVPVTKIIPPLKPLESFQYSVPIIASDVQALVPMVGNGVRGWSFKAGDTKSFALTMLEALKNPDMVKEKGLNANEWVIKHRNWGKYAKIAMHDYASLTAEYGSYTKALIL